MFRLNSNESGFAILIKNYMKYTEFLKKWVSQKTILVYNVNGRDTRLTVLNIEKVPNIFN